MRKMLLNCSDKDFPGSRNQANKKLIQLQTTYNFLNPRADGFATVQSTKSSLPKRNLLISEPDPSSSKGKKQIPNYTLTESWKFLETPKAKYRGVGPKPSTLQLSNEKAEERSPWEGSEKRKRIEKYMTSHNIQKATFENEKGENRWRQKEIGDGSKLVKAIGNKHMIKHYQPRKFEVAKVGNRFHYMG